MIPEEGRKANEIQHGGDHYKGAEFQHWDLISQNHIGYLEGCATKYASRWRKKNGVEDLKKAIHYVDKLVEVSMEREYRASGQASRSDLYRFFRENKIEDESEQLAITLLCRWKCLDDLLTARKCLIMILGQAQAAA
jgi:hypothetical protein